MSLIKKLIFTLTLCFSISASAKCISFSFGVNSSSRNEFAFLECKSKQVFQNSDLFNIKKKSTYFIGESLITKNIKFNKINKALSTIVKRSKKKSIKKMFASHNMHLTIGKQSYQLNKKHFRVLKHILRMINKSAQKKNGVLIKNKKFFQFKNKINSGPVKALKLRSIGDSYFYNGLYWKK